MCLVKKRRVAGLRPMDRLGESWMYYIERLFGRSLVRTDILIVLIGRIDTDTI